MINNKHYNFVAGGLGGKVTNNKMNRTQNQLATELGRGGGASGFPYIHNNINIIINIKAGLETLDCFLFFFARF